MATGTALGLFLLPKFLAECLGHSKSSVTGGWRNEGSGKHSLIMAPDTTGALPLPPQAFPELLAGKATN